MKIGDAVGMRSLLDAPTCKKHIIEHREKFFSRVGLNQKELVDEFKRKIANEGTQGEQRRNRRKLVEKSMTKFCKKCFEARKAKCDCELLRLDPDEQMSIVREDKSGTISEFNDSHEFDISMRDEESVYRVDSPHLFNEEPERDLINAYKKQKLKVRSQIENLTKPKDPKKKD